MPLTLEETKISNTQEFSEMLNDLQANILKHHGRNFAFHLFLSIKPGKVNEARNWIANFATASVTSAAKQLIDTDIKNENGIDGRSVFNLSISASGYGKLEVQADLRPEGEAFQLGMRQRNAHLADKTADWEDEFQQEIDLLIIVGNDLEATAIERKDDLLNQLNPIFDVVKVQQGQILKNADGIGIEHFGYADGTSQPLFLEKEVNKQNNQVNPLIWDDEARLKLALVKDKGGMFEDSYGSYLVFRKLEQNVKVFNESVENLPDVKTETGDDNNELAGAMIVGRFKDSTEVVNSSESKGITRPEDMNNNFDYSSDPDASKCPFHSHIRVTNPRFDVNKDTDIDSFVKSVRLVRRGIPYNEIGRIGTEGEPTSGVGLLFMCYQSSLEKQFEFIQSDWANHGNILPRFVGQDGLIGQGQNDFQKELPEQWGNANGSNNCEFSNPDSNFVTMKGGEYFFTPSISFLKSLLQPNPAQIAN